MKLNIIKSHPTWVRELKLRRQSPAPPKQGSHPTWVRELKQLPGAGLDIGRVWSHPTWVRELKLQDCVNS